MPLLALDVPVRFDSLPEQMRATFVQRANGDVEAGRRAYEATSPWRTAGAPRQFTSMTFLDAGIFLMHDRPREFDSAMAEFAARLK